MDQIEWLLDAIFVQIRLQLNKCKTNSLSSYFNHKIALQQVICSKDDNCEIKVPWLLLALYVLSNLITRPWHYVMTQWTAEYTIMGDDNSLHECSRRCVKHDSKCTTLYNHIHYSSCLSCVLYNIYNVHNAVTYNIMPN